MTYRISIIATCITLILLPSHLPALDQLNVVTEPMFLTVEDSEKNINDSQKELQGIITKFVTKMLDNSKTKYTISVLPWKRALHYASTEANSMIYPIARTAERESKFIWIGKIINVKYYFYQLGNRKDISINKLEDAQKLTLGMIASYPLEKYLIDRGFNNLEYVSDDHQSIKMLLSKRIDIFPKSNVGIITLCIELEYSCNLLKAAFEVSDMQSDIYIAVSKNTDPQVIAQLKFAFNNLVESGDHQRLMESLSIERIK